MKSIKYLILILPVLLGGCSNRNERKLNNPKYAPEVEVSIQRIINNLQVRTSVEGVYESKSLAGQLKYYHTPGLSIAVFNNGKIEWARGFGIRNEITQDSVDINTLFEAGSVSKPIFAMAVMRLKQKGILDLDKDVNEYLKSWKIPANKDWQPKITLRQLLSHTAGLTVHGFPGYLKSEPIPTLPQLLNGEYPANTGPVIVNILPGTTFRYSGGGTTVAQLTLMDVTGKPFPAIMKEELFNPLALKYCTYAQPLPDSLEGIASTAFPYKGRPINGRFHVYPEMAAAGLWSNPSELATLLIEVQRGLKGESSLYKKETIEEMLKPQKIMSEIGIGFFLESKGDSTRFGHNGWDEGFVAMAKAYKNLGKGAVILVNSNEGYELMDEIMHAIAIEYQWPDYTPPVKKEAKFTKEEIKKNVGSYIEGDNEFKIEESENCLRLIYQNQDPIVITKNDEGNFTNPQLNFSISFANDSLKFTQQGNTRIYKRK